MTMPLPQHWYYEARPGPTGPHFTMTLKHDEEDTATTFPAHLRGDGPCSNCGTLDNIVWFTDSVFWNAVVRVEPRLTDGAEILCIPCFVKMADERGFICHWRLLPEWKWQTKKGRLESCLERDKHRD